MKIELWTDGACAVNPGPGGWGYVIAYPDGTRCESSGSDKATTNNRMEIMAAIEGLRAIATPSIVEVVTDSAYVEQPFTKGWIVGWERRGWQRANRKGKLIELKNAELWSSLAKEVARHRKVSWRRVRGHTGYELNERCDQLAVAATLIVGGKPAEMVELSDRPKKAQQRTRRVREVPMGQLSVFNLNELGEEARKRYSR